MFMISETHFPVSYPVAILGSTSGDTNAASPRFRTPSPTHGFTEWVEMTIACGVAEFVGEGGGTA